MTARWLVPLVLLVGVIAEIWLLVAAVETAGVLPTIGVLVGMALLGAYLWRRQGGKALQSLFEAPADAPEVGRRVTDAALVVVAGGLLIVPGFLSDILALLCLVPGTRAVVRRVVGAASSAFGRPYASRINLLDLRLNPDTVVEGETVENPGPDSTAPRPQPNDPRVIRGEIED